MLAWCSMSSLVFYHFLRISMTSVYQLINFNKQVYNGRDTNKSPRKVRGLRSCDPFQVPRVWNVLKMVRVRSKWNLSVAYRYWEERPILVTYIADCSLISLIMYGNLMILISLSRICNFQRSSLGATGICVNWRNCRIKLPLPPPPSLPLTY